MLKSFTVDNFKSLVNCSFQPGGLNLLIGSNNAGKTNLCQALRFLSLTSRLPLDDAAATCTAEPWNLLNVYVSKDTLTLGMSCDLSLGPETLFFRYELTILSERRKRFPPSGRAFTVSSEILKVSGGGFTDTTLLENKDGHVRLLHEKRFLREWNPPGEPHYVETTAPTDATMLFRLYDLETNQRSNLFKKYLGSWRYYNLDPTRLRNNQARSMDFVLQPTGSNLASVLYSLHNAHPRVEKKVLDAVTLLEPRLDLFSFQSPDPEHVYMFFEDGRGNKFGLDNVSDGTLRYLAMSYLLISGQEQIAGADGTPLIIIEEPENGIFVGYLKDLLAKIDREGRYGQFIFTSHNPYFIDLFDAALDGLFLIKSANTHSTLIKPDASTIKDRLGKFSLGEIHFRGVLE